MRIKALFVLFAFAAMCSCDIESNSLTQVSAEKTVRAFLAAHTLQTPNLEVSPASVREIGEPNIYSQFNTSVTVHFNKKNNEAFKLLFDFQRTPDDKWFLQSVETVKDPIPELNEWLKGKRDLNFAVE